MTKIEVADLRRHRPGPEHDASWQESFFLGWYDAENGCGGSHHISLHPHGEQAHVWSWLVADGKLVGRSQIPTLPIPDSDYADMKLGTLHLKTDSTGRKLDLHTSFDDAQADISYESLCDPLEIKLNTGGLTLGGRHYETMGHVKGKAAVSGREIEFSGTGWQDHSWGPRKWYEHRAGRWLYAVFGDDLACSTFAYNTPTGLKHFGWVFDSGKIYFVRHVNFRAIVADDGFSPAACDALIRTEGGRGYRITGKVDLSILTGGDAWIGGAWYAMDGLAQFECGGRLGTGFWEVNELKSLMPEQRRELNMA
jgi:hypothetical protein